MKKLALTSLMAVFAVSGAHAANVIDGNPLYMPGQNHFYSVTDLGSHTKQGTPWGLGEEFGYGILDNLAVDVTTSLSENRAFEEYAWDDFGAKLTFRTLDMNGWKLDVYGSYAFTDLYSHPRKVDEDTGKKQDAWFDEDETWYEWTAGVRGGFVGSNWTVAGRTEFVYKNTRSFNWNADAGHQGVHTLVLGLDGQYVVCDHLSLVGTVEYTGRLDSKNRGSKLPEDKVKNEGKWFGEFGVNYNIDATKFVGLYINGTMNHWKGDDVDEVPNPKKGWGFEEGFGYGIKFGIDF